MKRKIISFFTLLLTVLFSAVAFFGCKEDTVEPVVIEIVECEADTTLLSYMTELESAGELDFELKDGMITQMNGTANGTNSYWMLYTSDTANANSEWGTYEYEGQTLGSATLGAESLIAVEGAVYVWVYQTF